MNTIRFASEDDNVGKKKENKVNAKLGVYFAAVWPYFCMLRI